MDNKSKYFWIKLISGISLCVIAIVCTLSIMLPSYFTYQDYYNKATAEKAEKKRLNSLPLELLGISAELADGVVYYDNDSADPETSDFVVKANFTEKGKDFSRRLSSKDFTIDVPEDFAKKGGTIGFSYIYTPETKKDEEAAEPIEKTTTLDIKLAEPDDTVFKVVKAPTFTDEGIAENPSKTQKTLPVLNQTNYVYTFDTRNKIAKFFYEELNLNIKIAVESEITVYRLSDSKAFSYNSVDCHFATDFENVKISYNDGAFVFTVGDDKTATIGRVSHKGKLVFAGNGTINLGNMTATNLTFKTGLTVNLDGAIDITDMLLETGATLNVTANKDTVLVRDDGTMKLLGNFNAKCKTKDKFTCINLYNNSSIVLSDESRVVIEDYEYAVGKWVDNDYTSENPKGRKGNIYMPSTSALSGKVIADGETKLMDGSNCKNFHSTWSINLIKVSSDYKIVTAPTFETAGAAKKDMEPEAVTLPKLNYVDYIVDFSVEKLVFTHPGTKVVIEVSLKDENAWKGGDLTVKYSDETGYTFTIAEGKTIELTGDFNVAKSSLTIAGKGSLTLNGYVSVTNLTVESGATFNIIAPRKTDVVIINAGGTVKLFGTTEIRGFTTGTTGICFKSPASTVYLSETSRVKITGSFDYPMGYFNSNENIKLYYPANATYASNKITDADGNVLLEYTKYALRIEFTKQEA